MMLAFIMSSAGIIPAWCTTYNIVGDWLVPLAAVLYMLETDLSK